MKYFNFLRIYIFFLSILVSIPIFAEYISNSDLVTISINQRRDGFDVVEFMQQWCVDDEEVPLAMIQCCTALTNNEPVQKADLLRTLDYMATTIKNFIHKSSDKALNRLFSEVIEDCDFSDIIELIDEITIFFNICCSQLEPDFNGTFTVLADIYTSITTCCAIIEKDFTSVFTSLTEVHETLTTCCAQIAVNFQGTLTAVDSGFIGTFTSLTDLEESLTACCEQITVDFQTLFTTIANLSALCREICLPLPIAAPATINAPGYYCLQADGTGPITINANDVTLDLNNHTVSGTGSGSGIIVNAGLNRVIKNGLVVNFDTGILGNLSDNTLVTNVHIADCISNGILFIDTVDTILDKVTIITVTGVGVQFTGTNTSNTIKAVSVTQASQGFVLTNFSNGLLIDCQVTDCTSASVSGSPFYGYLFTNGAFNQIMNCNVKNFVSTQSRGISLIGCTNAIVYGCTMEHIITATSSDVIGIEYDMTSSNIECKDCLVTDITAILGCNGFALEGNTITVNNCTAVSCTTDSSINGNGFLVTGTNVSLNTCQAYENSANGFLATSQALAILQSCYSSFNNNGFVIDNNVLVGKCIATFNGNIGFNAPATAIIYKCFASENGTNYTGTVPNVQNANTQVDLANSGLSGPFAGGNLFS